VNFNARANAEEIRKLAAGSVGVNLTAIGTAPTHPAYNILIVNNTDEILQFGWYQKEDGLKGRLALPAGTGITLDLMTNKKGKDGDLCFPVGRTIYVRQDGVPTTGNVYVTYFYGEGA